MEYKLTKTFLSQRLHSHSFLMAIIGLSLLFLLFGIDQKDLMANGEMIFEQKEYWRAFSTTLLHADLNHLAHNAFFFTGLAMLLHRYFGFWVFPILSFIMGGFINIVTLYFYPPEVKLVRVSGVVYFMAAFWLTLYILIEKRQTLVVRFLHAIGVTLIFLFPEAFQPQTSYLAHGVGFLFGVPAGLVYYFYNRKKIRAKDVWTPIEKEHHEWDNVILLDENSYHQVKSEDDGPSRHV